MQEHHVEGPERIVHQRSVAAFFTCFDIAKTGRIYQGKHLVLVAAATHLWGGVSGAGSVQVITCEVQV